MAGLDALEVEDGEPAEGGQRAGAAGVDDGVHGGGDTGIRSGMPAKSCSSDTSAGSTVSVPGARETSSKL